MSSYVERTLGKAVAGGVGQGGRLGGPTFTCR